MIPDFIVHGKKIFLTRTERQIYDLLASDRSKIFSTSEIEKEVWATSQNSNIVQVYINLLRKKLGSRAIESRRGYGYCLSKG